MDTVFQVIQQSPGLRVLGLRNLSLTQWANGRPSGQARLPDLQMIGLGDLPVTFIHHFLASIIASRCVCIFVQCHLRGGRTDEVFDWSSESLHNLFAGAAISPQLSIQCSRNTISLSSWMTRNFFVHIGGVRDPHVATERCLSFYPPCLLAEARDLKLTPRLGSSHILAVLARALPSLESLTLHIVNQESWVEVATFLSRPNSPKRWPQLHTLHVVQENQTLHKLTPELFLQFLKLRIVVSDEGTEDKFGKLSIDGVLDESFTDIVREELASLVDKLQFSRGSAA
ncbi:hypothetical protein FRB99_003231, partial [Tulasnella sp. 403]